MECACIFIDASVKALIKVMVRKLSTQYHEIDKSNFTDCTYIVRIWNKVNSLVYQRNNIIFFSLFLSEVLLLYQYKSIFWKYVRSK